MIVRISYCPKSVGKYSIHVLDSEQNTAGKPIKVDVFDPNMIKLSKIGDAVLGQDNRIRVDTGKPSWYLEYINAVDLFYKIFFMTTCCNILFLFHSSRRRRCIVCTNTSRWTRGKAQHPRLSQWPIRHFVLPHNGHSAQV